MSATLSAESQKLSLSAPVALYRLDATSVGAAVYYFVKGSEDNVFGVHFGGQLFRAIDINVEDFEVNAGGALPTPKMQIANTDLLIQNLVNTYGDLAGCEVRRMRTFYRFLDGQPDADATAYMGPDVFRVERKSEENDVYIEWELSAAIDQEGKMLPGRQFIRDVCMRRYRIYNPTSPNAASDGFVYPKIFPCKYTGSNSYTATGAPTTPANDRCGRKISDCKLRFGNEPALPMGAFPGIGRVPTE